MKLNIGLLILIITTLHNVSVAQNLNSEFRVAAYNDSWGGGFTTINDDLRTFHFEGEYRRGEKLKIFSRYSLLTNRFDENIDQRKTWDELLLTGSYSILQSENINDGSVWVRGGLIGVGSFMGLQIQEFAHNTFGVAQTELEYYEHSGVFPLLGLDLKKSLVQHSFDPYELRLGIHLSVDHSLGYYTRSQISAPISFSSARTKIVFTPSYSANKGYWDDINALNNALESESGLGLAIKVVGKNVYFHFETFPGQSFSYGGFGIRIHSKDSIEHIEPKRDFLKIETSVLSEGYGYNFKYSFAPFELLNRNGYLIVNHNYHTYLKKYIPQSPTINGHANQITAGAELFVRPKSSQIRILEPYVNLSIGDRAVNVYSKTIDLSKSTSHLLAINNDIGLQLNVPLRIRMKQRHVTVSAFHRFTNYYSIDKSQESPLLFSTTNSPYASWQNLIGAGITFGI